MIKTTCSKVSLAVLLFWLVWATGCAGPGPKMFPPAPLQQEADANGGTTRWYDTDNDGEVDFCEKLSPEGTIEAIGYDEDTDGRIDDLVVLDEVPRQERRHLVLILDSIPYEMVEQFRQSGRLRYFPPPSQIISPFPVMTDVCLSDFFGTLPVPGMEAVYYEDGRLTDAFDIYLTGKNAAWQALIDYRLSHVAHPYAYTWPKGWTNHELRKIRKYFLQNDQKVTIGYVVGGSALGAGYGRTGHQIGLVRLDRFCQAIMHDTRGRARITIFSDHGHFYGESKRIRLAKNLKYMGYKLSDRLEGPYDVVVPEFGLVTCAAIYTNSPQQVASDVLGLEGMALSAYENDNGSVTVLSRTGEAVISEKDNRYRYQPVHGDPLELHGILHDFKKQGKADDQGYVSEQAWFEATKDEQRPLAVCRLWRSFHDMIRYEPNVLATTQDGYFCGSGVMEDFIALNATHGNLRRASSIGFATSMAGELPDVVRMMNLREALVGMGVDIGTLPQQD